MFGPNPSTGADSHMSRASPCGSPSMMSIRTTSSASPFCTTRIAVVAPTNPLPTTVTRIEPGLLVAVRFDRSYGKGGDVRGTGGSARTEVPASASPPRSVNERAHADQAGLLEHQPEVVWLRACLHGIVHRHQAVPDQVQQRLVEGLHAVEG